MEGCTSTIGSFGLLLFLVTTQHHADRKINHAPSERERILSKIENDDDGDDRIQIRFTCDGIGITSDVMRSMQLCYSFFARWIPFVGGLQRRSENFQPKILVGKITLVDIPSTHNSTMMGWCRFSSLIPTNEDRVNPFN